MALSPTAERMIGTLPDYYWGNPLVERLFQARANEIDRADAILDAIKVGAIPGQAADDSLKMLSMWEQMLGLPVNPRAATAQRKAMIMLRARTINVQTAQDVYFLLSAELGGGFSVARDTPELRMDTVTVHYTPGTFIAAVVERIVKRAWPAHRLLLMTYDAGFILDGSRMDEDTF